MSGLSKQERAGCTKIINMLTQSDLLSLCDTVTKKMIAVESSTEAVEAILTYSTSAEELLRRKKVHRELLFSYLVKEGVVMSTNSEKHQLVKRTLELWSSGTELHHTDVKADPGFDPLVLGRQFCQWFFQLLNSQNPSLGQQHLDWGPQHFWPDAKLRLLSSVNGEHTEEFAGAEMVNLRLLSLTKEERLLLRPNLDSHGLRALASPHGLVLVAVAGTIHRDTVCLGVYEQIFGLIRSPLDNDSWKIKFINLKIRGQDTLVGTETAAPMLTCDSSELQLLCR
ncbi:uncharacterized protein C3orf38 homolog [Thalassophryne amazonica]|uniref:uncharacterized protein C3orf38 homolog n=1 Tax=Thalassophryne amazonica TaxID=390379 RepID=UPI00147089BA|nr:uncharacterized protein C3orf38 homolog [Thalassophryne amazonica]